MGRFKKGLRLEDVPGTSLEVDTSIAPLFASNRSARASLKEDTLPDVENLVEDVSVLPEAVAAAAVPAFEDGWAGNKWTEKPGNGAPANGTPPDSGTPGKPDTAGSPDNGNGGVGNPDPGGDTPNNGNGGVGNPDPGGDNPGNGNGGVGNPDAGGPGNGNGGVGNPDPGGDNPGNGNGGVGNPDAGGPGNGNGGEGNPNPGGGGSDKPGAPTPPDVLLLDIDTADYVASYTFSIDDITGDFDGSTVATDPTIINYDISKETKEGVTLYAIDSAFGFYTTDFVGAQDKVRDGDYAEGWAGNLTGPAGEIIGIAVSDAPTDTLSTPAQLGTWLQGIGGNSVKASTEHYTVMQAVLSDQAYPGDTSGLYQLDDDLKMIDFKVLSDGMPDLDANGNLQADVMHDFYINEMVQALSAADSADPLPSLDFDRDGTVDTYSAYMADIDFEGVTHTVAAVDIGSDGVIDFHDGPLNGFGVYGVVDILKPNESTILEDIAYGDDYSVTVKDDGKLLYRWGNMIKRPNDLRIDAKIELPDEWQETDANGLKPLYLVTGAELLVNHTVTNNPNDQIRPEDFENEAAIGTLPTYTILNEGTDQEQWVSTADYYAGDGTLLPAGTVLRDMSLVDLAQGSTLAEIGALSSDLTGGFTEAWYTTMDREPFQADLNDDGTAYDIGPRWRLQPDKYGQDLPSVTIPIDPSDPLPVENGEEKYEVGADTTTVINLLDWAGTSPLTLSAGWMTDAGEVSVNGLNMTEDFDIAFYVKGDIKPVNLYDVQLVMNYEEVQVNGTGETVIGGAEADVLVGMGSNTFQLAIDGESDLIIFGYGAETASAVGTNSVEGFMLGEDALGLIGFDLNRDNFEIHIGQEVSAEGLEVSLDGVEIAMLDGVTGLLGADDFYFA